MKARLEKVDVRLRLWKVTSSLAPSSGFDPWLSISLCILGPPGLVEGPAAIIALSGLLQLEVQMLGLSPGIIALSTLLPLPLILSNFLLNF